nr:hypothetical protein Iba_chr01fCG7860 [Ipomoea batatas]
MKSHQAKAELQASLEASKKADNVVSFSVSSSSGTVSLPVSVSPSFVSSLPSAVVCYDMASSSCVTSVAASICALKSVPSNLLCVSVDFADVRARVLSIQSILTSLKSTVAQMEKMLLQDKKLLQSFEADDNSAQTASSPVRGETSPPPPPTIIIHAPPVANKEGRSHRLNLSPLLAERKRAHRPSALLPCTAPPPPRHSIALLLPSREGGDEDRRSFSATAAAFLCQEHRTLGGHLNPSLLALRTRRRLPLELAARRWKTREFDAIAELRRRRRTPSSKKVGGAACRSRSPHAVVDVFTLLLRSA